MTTQDKLIARYGNPMEDRVTFERKWMTLWDVPLNINTHIPCLPNQIFINKEAVSVFENWFQQTINHRLYNEFKTFDGCYNPRLQRGSKTKISFHSFGLAMDFNAHSNPRGLTYEECTARGYVPFSKNFVLLAENCFLTAGGNFRGVPDRMHFEYHSVK